MQLKLSSIGVAFSLCDELPKFISHRKRSIMYATEILIMTDDFKCQSLSLAIVHKSSLEI